MEPLPDILRRTEVETLLHNAHMVCDWPDERQRSAAAERLIRTTMYEAALGRISHAVKQHILVRALNLGFPDDVAPPLT